jgi:hypothetical protein
MLVEVALALSNALSLSLSLSLSRSLSLSLYDPHTLVVAVVTACRGGPPPQWYL